MDTKQNYFLVGPMGSGKSTVGKQLASALGYEFFDSDKEIEQSTGVSISLIFELEGETGFRKRERNIIAQLSARSRITLATGGGSILDPENRKSLKNNGFVIYLQASTNQILKRTRRDSSRPLLQTEDPAARLNELMEIRAPLYESIADLVLNTDSHSVSEVAQQVLRYIRKT